MGESGGVLDGGVGVNLPPLGAHAMLKPNYMDRVSLSKPEKTCQKERDHQVQPSNVILMISRVHVSWTSHPCRGCS